ncbi:MAG TPA: sigma-70 family RNA polymerase sigma factor [Acidimicrobiales bacterium]
MNRELISGGRVEKFEEFVSLYEPRLRRALVTRFGTEEGRDATAEALGYAWEHWDSLQAVANPLGYLFRVGQSRSRKRELRVVFLLPEMTEHDFEPKLPDALRKLSEHQRLAVVLVHAYSWRITEVAELLGVKPNTVQNHLARGLRRLRKSIGAEHGE